MSAVVMIRSVANIVSAERQYLSKKQAIPRHVPGGRPFATAGHVCCRCRRSIISNLKPEFADSPPAGAALIRCHDHRMIRVSKFPAESRIMIYRRPIRPGHTVAL
eukprot:750928-Hanusia_phi.AAC.4